MKDLRQYSSRELSLWVYNDEFLYSQRFRSSFIDLVSDIFLYTDEQLEELINDIAEEQIEEAV